jgi:hypothetical protein
MKIGDPVHIHAVNDFGPSGFSVGSPNRLWRCTCSHIDPASRIPLTDLLTRFALPGPQDIGGAHSKSGRTERKEAAVDSGCYTACGVRAEFGCVGPVSTPARNTETRSGKARQGGSRNLLSVLPWLRDEFFVFPTHALCARAVSSSERLRHDPGWSSHCSGREAGDNRITRSR